MKAYVETHTDRHFFFTSALVGGMWSASRSGRFTLGKEPRITTGWNTGWATKPVWTTCRLEHSWYQQDSNSDSLVVQPVASRYTDCAVPAHYSFTKQHKGTIKIRPIYSSIWDLVIWLCGRGVLSGDLMARYNEDEWLWQDRDELKKNGSAGRTRTASDGNGSEVWRYIYSPFSTICTQRGFSFRIGHAVWYFDTKKSIHYVVSKPSIQICSVLKQ
jgi:hypothetical protein